MDLSPREVTEPPQRPKRRNWGAIVFLAAVVVGGGVIVGKFLTSAVDYYCNADEIDVKPSCSGERRVRVQGLVDQNSLTESADGGIRAFTITFNGTSVPIDYENGSPLPDLFRPCIPVVVEGRLSGGRVEGTNVEVKHTNEYEAENQDRIKTSNDQLDQGDECS